MNTFLVVAAFMAAIAASAVAFPLLRNRQSRLIGAVAGLLVIGAAAGLYPLWSNWDWRAPDQPKTVGPEVLAMIAKLEKHMQDEPNDATGWLLLGRSYLALERTDDAILAYDHAHRLDAKNTEAMLGLGEAMSMRAGGNVTPAAAELFEQAVTLEPENPKALLYSGFGALARGDRAAARSRWRTLKGMHPPPQIESMLDQKLAELGTGDLNAPPGAEQGAAVAAATAAVATPPAGPAAGSPAGAQATINLSIAPALKSRLTADTPLFLFAREPGSRGPPLAAKRLTGSAIGTQIQLSSADSMMPGRVLTAGQRVSITARVSFSGQPLPAAGDLFGELTYEVGHDGARDLVIDQVAQ
jgi:cytochrome c-type biogenesis protein CcmH